MSVAETLLLNGQLSINPSPSCSCDPDLSTMVTLSEQMSISAKQSLSFTVPSDAAFPVDLTTTPNVNALFIDVSQKVILTITTADGAAQVIPVDPVMVWLSALVPITALSITRQVGVDTTVRLILGDKA
jgi:hypothetical protein